MTTKHRLLAGIATLVIVLLCAAFPVALTEEAPSVGSFPEGTIEVPQGTEIYIDDINDVVTIVDNPIEISDGDTFVVYLQDLPVGYVAESVKVQDSKTIISVEKADKSLYALLDESGVIELTPDMYEFIPAPNVMADSVTIGGDGLSYSDGKLIMKVAMDGSYSEVYLSDLSLSHSISGGDISLVLNGNWGIETQMKISEDLLEDLPLGELRIFGIGKIGVKLSLDQSMSMKVNLGGSFSAGLTASQDGTGQAIKEFSVSEKTVEGQGSISASLKITAGIDILVAEVDVYVEVGVKTQYTSKYHIDPDTEETVHCDDFKIYLFSTVGAEAKYYSIAAGKMKPLASKDVDLIDDDSPFILRIHFEDGALVGSCRFGMEVPDLEFGGLTTSFGSTLLTEDRVRVLETDVDLPWDMTIESDYRIANGTLNLNGHTLTIMGDLIQSGGTLKIGSGRLIVKGDYRIQGETEIGNGIYMDSTGSLRMDNVGGIIDLEGDFVIQTRSTSHLLNAGTFNIKGDFEQITPMKGTSNFKSGTGCNFVLDSSKNHSILTFDDAENNSIGWITMKNDVTSQGDISLGAVDMNGYKLVINGTFNSVDCISMQDYSDFNDVYTPSGDMTLESDMTVDSGSLYRGINLNGYSLTVNGDMVSTSDITMNGGTLTVTGTLYQRGGTIDMSCGTLNIGGSYYMTGGDSNYETERYTTANAYLKMYNAEDVVRIGGNFVVGSYCYSGSNAFTNGTIYLGGNFRQIEGYRNNFSASGNHKMVFNGTGTQKIRFDSIDHGFGQIAFENPNIEVTGAYLGGFTLQDDINLTLATDTLTISGTMNLNGYSIGDGVYNGNLTLNGGALISKGANITINGNLNCGTALQPEGYGITVNGDMVSTGDMTMNAGTLTVTGTLYQRGGTIDMSCGTLNIGGSYYMTGGDSSYETERYTTADAYLKMYNAEDVVRIGGNFVVGSYCYSGSNAFTNGTIYLGGNFRQIEGYRNNFSASGNHKMVFNGTGTQKIRFDSASHGFCLVAFENPNIEVTGAYLGGFTLQDDINLTLATDTLTISGTMNLNGHSIGDGVYNGNLTLSGGALISKGANITINGNLNCGTALQPEGYGITVNGDMVSTGDMTMNGGTLTVTGTLYQRGGTIDMSCGTLNIGGSYYITGGDSNYETERYTTANAYLKMYNAEDVVQIGGNFVVGSYCYSGSNAFTNGTIYLGGNFRQIEGYRNNFSASGNHKMVFNGTGTQKIRFDSASHGFCLVTFENPNIEVTGAYLGGFTLQDDINLTLATDTLIISGTMNLNGHSLGSNTIEGDFTLIGGQVNVNGVDLTVNGNLISRCNIDLNGHDLTVNGNMTSEANIDLNGGYLTVTGTLYQEKGTMHINGGKLNVLENYYMTGGDSVYVPGREVYFSANSALIMEDSADEVRIGNHFVIASSNRSSEFSDGVMYVGGDFTQAGASNSFVADSGHKVVLTGNHSQSVRFENGNSTFNVLQIEMTLDNYDFSTTPCWNQLIQPETPETPEIKVFMLPSAMQAIESEAFLNNRGLVHVEIQGTNLTTIGDAAFKGCANLTQISLPSSVTSIADNAFEGCDRLVIICESNSYARQYADAHGIAWKEKQ